MAKRGRKRIHKRYFDDEQEEAIKLYLSCDDEMLRNSIYQKYLEFPLYKMVESIINRYQLYSRELSFDELLVDTLGFLHTKLDKFDPTKGKKAYSYYGTVVKHRLMGKRMRETTDLKRKISYEDKYKSIVSNEKYSYKIDNDPSVMQEFFYEFIEIAENLLEMNEKEAFLKVNEEKIGYAVIHLMKNWEAVFDDGSHKYNKNQVLECLRNMTNLSTKDIRESLKRFKLLYFQKKQEKMDNEIR